MPQPEDKTSGDFTVEEGPLENTDNVTPESVGFLPDDALDADTLRDKLRTADRDERIRLTSQVLSYAPWDEIWTYVERDTVRELFSELDLPTGLRAAWARLLDVDPGAESGGQAPAD